MKKNYVIKTVLASLMACSSYIAFGQGMAVNTSGSAANASAILDVNSTTQGMLVPRMTSAQRTAISSPATGLLVYQTDGTAGFYFYNGTAWTSLNGGGAPSGSAGGDLTGTYPNPTVASGAITNAKVSGTAGIAYSKLNLSGSVVLSDLSATGTKSSSTFLRGDNTWAVPSGGSGASLQVVATQAATVSCPAASMGASTTALTLDNVSTTPTAGSFSGGNFTASTAGTYLVTYSLAGQGLAQIYPVINLNGVVWAVGAANSNPQLPATTQSRGCISVVCSLSGGDVLSFSALNINTSTASTVSTDGTTRVTITKL